MEQIILNKIREIEEVCKLTEDYNSLNLHSLGADEYPMEQLSVSMISWSGITVKIMK